jgi:hypothetical protein
MLDSFRKKGTVDYYFGRRVRSLVEQTDFVNIGQEGWTFMVRGDDPWARVWEMAMQLIGENLIVTGVLTREQLESLNHHFLDPAFNYPGFTMFCAWARKPTEGGT